MADPALNGALAFAFPKRTPLRTPTERTQSSLHQTLTTYLAYYHEWRTHLSLGKDAPQSRRIQPIAEGEVFKIREVGVLRHHYELRAALTARFERTGPSSDACPSRTIVRLQFNSGRCGFQLLMTGGSQLVQAFDRLIEFFVDTVMSHDAFLIMVQGGA